MKTLPTLALLTSLCGSAHAQTFNIDFSSAANGFGVPSATYGAASGSTGHWHVVDPDLFGTNLYTSPPLVTTSGAASPVVLEFNPLGSGGLLAWEFDSPTTSGEDEALLDDSYFNGDPHTLTIRNLAPGSYTLYTYAMAPDDNTFLTGVNVIGSPDPVQPVGGDFSAGFQLGVTHARHTINVAAGSAVVIRFSVIVGIDTVNGLQIVSSAGGAVGTNYCTTNANSTGSPGVISGAGSATVVNNNLALVASALPNNSFGFFLTSTTQGFIANPGGSQGNLCLGSSIGRYVGAGQIQNSGAAGTFSLPLDLTQTPTPTGLVAVTAGETRNFQAWFRDANPTATSNFTNGLSVLFN